MNAPFSPRIANRDPFSAFLADAPTEEIVKDVAASAGWSTDRVYGGGVRFATQTLAMAASPNVLLVDLSGSEDPLLDIDGLAEVCEPGTVVICCGEHNDVRLYRELISSGIQDYLVKPFTADQLEEVIQTAQSSALDLRQRESDDQTPHVSVAVIGVRGGIGCSTVASSLAWILANQKAHSTALLDLDVHFGTGALSMDIEPGRGLTDAMENPGRIDGLFIERALVKAGDKLGILSAEAPIHQPLPDDPTSFIQLQEELRAAYVCTVIDMPRHMLVQHPILIHEANVVLVVTELSLAATRDTIRLLAWLRSNAPQARVMLIANKVPAPALTEVNRKDFETSIERQIDHVIAHDAKLAVQAAKVGKTVAEIGKSGKTGHALAEIASRILDLGEAVAADAAKPAATPSLSARLTEMFKPKGKPAK